jgi:hypothetical protein
MMDFWWLDIVNLGAVGIFAVVFWKQLVKKDKKSYEMIDAQNVERKEMYVNMSELVKEVTVALTNKNNTDDKMTEAVKKFTEQLREMKQALKDNTGGSS